MEKKINTLHTFRRQDIRYLETTHLFYIHDIISQIFILRTRFVCFSMLVCLLVCLLRSIGWHIKLAGHVLEQQQQQDVAIEVWKNMSFEKVNHHRIDVSFN